MNLANTAIWVVALVSRISNSTDEHCKRSRQIVIRLNVLKTVQQVKYIPPHMHTHAPASYTRLFARGEIESVKQRLPDVCSWHAQMSALEKKVKKNSTNYNNVSLDFTSRLFEDFVLKNIWIVLFVCKRFNGPLQNEYFGN